MDYILLVGVAVSLSMDAFAVSVCRGLQMKNGINIRHMLLISAFFGGFQALMPTIGYILGQQFERYIMPIDHWIAFALLGFLGGKMVVDVIRDARAGTDGCDDYDDCACCDYLDIKQLCLMSVATSVDALAVGITLPTLGVATGEQAAVAVSIIGVITFALCMLGVAIGNRFGTKFKNKATLAGGIVLILIGAKILLEHLGIINF